jgi:hypothetical protein
MIGEAVDLELARHHWNDGRRAIERARSDPERYDTLSAGVQVVQGVLPRRLGQVFDLETLVQAYAGSDRWVLEALHDAFPDGPPPEGSLIASAAFELYAHRASDYSP